MKQFFKKKLSLFTLKNRWSSDCSRVKFVGEATSVGWLSFSVHYSSGYECNSYFIIEYGGSNIAVLNIFYFVGGLQLNIQTIFILF